MNKRYLIFFLGFLCLPVIFSCERDDICIESVVESPDIILLMLDYNDINIKKRPSGFAIRAIGTEKVLPKNGSSDSLKLPLKIQENIVQFEFIINQGSEDENIDTLQINYQRFDRFINTACGYRSNYILESKPITILNPGNNWILGFSILRDTISDETKAHLGILH